VPVVLEFQPQLILVSAGFDTHHDDPIGGMRLTENGYAYLTDVLLGLAATVCQGKIVFILEGGYDLGGLRKSVKAVLETMCSGIPDAVKLKIEKGMHDTSPVPDIIANVRYTLEPYWKCFRDV
jgi:acetoin utilization deacetylase AcuC-like enzyme